MTPTQNSLVVFIRDLLENLRHDIVRIHGAHSKEIHRDFDSVLNRLEHEGLPFVTSTLPKLGKAILQSFLTGKLETPQGFKQKSGTTLPRLLSGLLVQGYDNHGQLKTNIDVQVVRSLLQVTFLLYKLELPFKKAAVEQKLESFLKAESDLRLLNLNADDDVLQYARALIVKVFQGFNPKEITPGHGPGAVATGEKDEGKWVIKRKYANLHAYYPYYEYFIPSHSSICHNNYGLGEVGFEKKPGSFLESYRRLVCEDEASSIIRLVPKDSRGPRIISMEPLELQFAQQGLKNELYRYIEGHPLTKGFVNFTDQTINGKLALQGSLTGRWATLDMKEASDRVSLQLVRILFHGTELLKALEAVRSQMSTYEPDEFSEGFKLRLMKYAPMGSAVCFPVEAMVFWALSKAIIAYERGELNCPSKDPVYVYGDDIIVETKYSSALKSCLPKYGLLVNNDKSYDAGPFRESCGSDCFKGNLVTPIKVKELWPCSENASTSIQSFAEYSNSFYEAGYFATASFLAQTPLLRRLTRLPKKYRSGIAIRRDGSFQLKTKTKHLTQTRLTLVTCLTHKMRVTKLRGNERLFANVTGHMTSQYVVPYATTCKLRWVDLKDGSLPKWAEELTRKVCHF